MYKFYVRYRRNHSSYQEISMPGERTRDNKGFEDEKGYSKHASFDSLPEPERPPLRHIDTYLKPECPCLSKRYTVAVLACIGKFKYFPSNAEILIHLEIGYRVLSDLRTI